MFHESEVHLRIFSVSISIEKVIYDEPEVNRQQMAPLFHYRMPYASSRL